jgi:hypothetical protein
VVHEGFGIRSEVGRALLDGLHVETVDGLGEQRRYTGGSKQGSNAPGRNASTPPYRTQQLRLRQTR